MLVRIEVFPERDGNLQLDAVCVFFFLRWSEWSSSLKGMETLLRSLHVSLQALFVRMELFPERDGNPPSSQTTYLTVSPGPNGALP